MVRPATAWAVLLANLACGAVQAGKEPEPPDLDFLEYLGLWQDQDEEWVGRAGWEDAEEARGDPDLAARPEVPRGDADGRREPEDAAGPEVEEDRDDE
jgi:hypothetical protein